VAKTNYEGKACDAVLRHLEGRLSASRKNVRFPEKEKDAAPVEIACRLNDQLYAFEHTTVEPFTGQIQNDVFFDRQFIPIGERLGPSVPAGERWELIIPVDAMNGLSPGQVLKVQDAVIELVQAASRQLDAVPWGPINRGRSFAQEDGAPISFSFRRWAMGPTYEGGLLGAHITRSVGNLETPRIERMRKTCDTKFAKLADWRRRGARSILVLSSDDIILTSPHAVAHAYLEAEQTFSERPDEVYFVWTWPDAPKWPLTIIRIGDRDFTTLCREGANQIEVDVGELSDLTH